MQKQNKPNLPRRLLHFFAHPVEDVVYLLRFLKWIKCHKKGQILLGAAIMALGSSIASSIPHGTPFFMHVLLDGIAYGLHGFGAAPIIKQICEAQGIDV